MDRSGERQLVSQVVHGDAGALGTLREFLHPGLHAQVRSRGATAAEADDLLADLWRDCLPGDESRGSLLERHNGVGSLKAWLATILTHRLVDLKRREQLHARYVQNQAAAESAIPTTTDPSESALSRLLRAALEAAFTSCTAESLVMLRLVHLHGITQREVGRMWGWHESKVSRTLSGTMADIREGTMKRLQQNDPWLELRWDDLVEVCEETPGSWLPG